MAACHYARPCHKGSLPAILCFLVCFMLADLCSCKFWHMLLQGSEKGTMRHCHLDGRQGVVLRSAGFDIPTHKEGTA